MAETQFVFWDVQHGSAAYIGTPSGRHIAIDLGIGSVKGSDTTFSPLRHLQRNYGVRQLDCVIITHPHRDHLGDIVNFDSLSPRVLLRPKHLSEGDIRGGNQGRGSTIIDKYLEINRRYNGTLAPGTSPLDRDNNGGVEFRWFTPKPSASSNLNNHSIVTVVTYVGCKIIVPGDNETSSWDELLARRDFRDAVTGSHILVAPHHGRESGFAERLFEYISPHLTIISDGPAGNTSVTERYARKSKGWQVSKRGGGEEQRRCLTTRRDGVIVVKFGQQSNGRPYIGVTID